MIFLFLSVLANTAFVLLFKINGKYRINSFHAISINYIVAALMGFSSVLFLYPLEEIVDEPWLFPVITMGFMCALTFHLVAAATRAVGMAIASVAFKMSFVIPVCFATFFFGDGFATGKIAGIALAVIAVVMVVWNGKKTPANNTRLFLPVAVFLGTGLLDTSFKLAQYHYLDDNSIVPFTAVLFFSAMIPGALYISVNLVRNQAEIKCNALYSGLVLGAMNWGAVYFMIRGLSAEGMESSVFFPVNNIGIVSLSSLCGVVFFREKLTPTNWCGLAVAILSMILIMQG